MFRTLARAAWLLVMVLLLPAAASAHDLKLDRLSLFPDPERAKLTGQLTLDPELTRGLSDSPQAQHAQQLLSIVKRDVSLMANDEPLAVTFEVRELWTPNGAVSGDIVMLRGELPQDTTTLAARLDGAIPALVLSVQPQLAQGVGSTHSVLLSSGQSSPVYRFAGPSSTRVRDTEGWRPGGPEQFALPESAASSEITTTEAPGFDEPATSSLLTYLRLGFVHVLPLGWDHLLFVLGITLGVGRTWKRLLPQLTLFTLAHTLTLGLGAAGVQLLPPAVIEPLIALSVAYVGLENLLSETRRFRLVTIFVFGLLHGQGFASALLDIGLPQDSFLWSLLSFNLGVEIAQIVVAGAAASLLMAYPASKPHARQLERAASLLIALIGGFWTCERVASGLGLI